MIINTTTMWTNNQLTQCESVCFWHNFHIWTNTSIKELCISQVVFSRHCSPCDIKELLCSSSNIARFVVLFPLLCSLIQYWELSHHISQTYHTTQQDYHAVIVTSAFTEDHKLFIRCFVSWHSWLLLFYSAIRRRLHNFLLQMVHFNLITSNNCPCKIWSDRF